MRVSKAVLLFKEDKENLFLTIVKTHIRIIIVICKKLTKFKLHKHISINKRQIKLKN